jgi:hypothetical protein
MRGTKDELVRRRLVAYACKLTKLYPVSWIMKVLNISLIDHKLEEEEICLKQQSKSCVDNSME